MFQEIAQTYGWTADEIADLTQAQAAGYMEDTKRRKHKIPPRELIRMTRG